MDLRPIPTEKHVIAVDDDFAETKAICCCGTLIYEGSDRNKKMAESYRHLANVLDPPQEPEESQ